MSVVELVATLRARGVELVPAGDRLRFRPGEAVTPEEREALRHHKAEVLALLGAPRPSPTPGPALEAPGPSAHQGSDTVDPGDPTRSEGQEALRPSPGLLDAITVHAVPGARPNPAAIDVLEAEVRAAITQYQFEVATGQLGPGVLLVRGRPLADYLDLGTVARLLRQSVSPRSGGREAK